MCDSSVREITITLTPLLTGMRGWVRVSSDGDQKCPECRHKIWMHHGTPDAAGSPCSGGQTGRNCQCTLHGPPPEPVRQIGSGSATKLVVLATRALSEVTTLELWLAAPSGAPPRAHARQAYSLMISLVHVLGRLRDGEQIPDLLHDDMLGIPWEVLKREANRLSRSGVTFAPTVSRIG
jgi:hypothetical protein